MTLEAKYTCQTKEEMNEIANDIRALLKDTYSMTSKINKNYNTLLQETFKVVGKKFKYKKTAMIHKT
jgi:hypothetical protein